MNDIIYLDKLTEDEKKIEYANMEENLNIMQTQLNTNTAFDQYQLLIQDGRYNDIRTNHINIIIDDVLQLKEQPFLSELKTNHKLYRARIIKNSDLIDVSSGIKRNKISWHFDGFNENNSREPFSSSGARNNHEGISYLYLAEDEYTACAEIQPKKTDYISLATFSLNTNVSLLDLGTGDNVSLTNYKNSVLEKNPELSSFINQYDVGTIFDCIIRELSRPVHGSTGYYFTQFFSDKVQKAGFDGIRYMSSIVEGNNITLYNTNKKYINFINSTVIRCLSTNYIFGDINSLKLYDISPQVKLKEPQEILKKSAEVFSDILHAKRTFYSGNVINKSVKEGDTNEQAQNADEK